MKTTHADVRDFAVGDRVVYRHTSFIGGTVQKIGRFTLLVVLDDDGRTLMLHPLRVTKAPK